ncbi:hypothetical protein VPNG_05790 [Cytospora leucostoma]|uniref:Protein kinase domain-containing protein n=1 Tax=Cytospora leucostoma TaxID=1230097 RepID=A0A423X0C0_9PEZI|nr:hypothetical protein VPNG_05790 [Cytospora leucostoma]
MASILRVGQVLKGRVSTYTLTKEVYKSADDGVVFLARQNHREEKCILKSIPGHWRLQNEATILGRYQDKTPFLRPLLDEIEEPPEPASIVLKYLDTDLLSESNKNRLSRSEIKQVARAVLEVLKVLHQDGMVHTDIKLDNIFVNYGQGRQRFSTIQLGDCGGVVHQDSEFARDGHVIGAAFTRSPESTFQLRWGTATDIWSFGNAILSLLYGGNYHVFNPANEGVKPDDDNYFYMVLKRMHRLFGPFPHSYTEFNDEGVNEVCQIINMQGPPQKPFQRVTPKEVPPADKKFLLKIMKLDPRDRPTAEELLADEWFTEESEDTRAPLPVQAPAGDDKASLPQREGTAENASSVPPLEEETKG